MRYVVISRYEERVQLEDICWHLSVAQEKMREVFNAYLNRYTDEEVVDIPTEDKITEYRATTDINNKRFDVYIIQVEQTSNYLVATFFNRDLENTREYSSEKEAYFKMEEYLIDYFQNDLEIEYDEEEFEKTRRKDWNITLNYAWCNKDEDLFEVDIIKIKGDEKNENC